jgi:hypothetical protein
MKIYNVIWLKDGEPSVQSFFKFKDALESVEIDIKNYEKSWEVSAHARTEDDWYFASMPGLLEVEIVKTKVL